MIHASPPGRRLAELGGEPWLREEAMQARRWWSVAVAAALIAGCVRAHPETVSQGRNVINEEQIAALQVTSAYDVVTRLRPDFLHGRGRESSDPQMPATPVHVYVESQYYSDDVNLLKSIPASDLEEIRFYQSYEAQYKFGSGHLGGVIQLLTKH
jgi:hypothetical protein